MKIYYCPHTGNLTESLKERRGFSTAKEALSYMVDSQSRPFGFPVFKSNDVYIQYCGYDARIGCENFYVCLGRYGDEDYLKKYSIPQAHGYLQFSPIWQDKVSEWKRVYKDEYISHEKFIDFFDNKK